MNPDIDLSPEYVQLIQEYKASELCQSRGHPSIARYMLDMMPFDEIVSADPYEVTDMLVEHGYCRFGAHIGKSRANIRHRVCRFQEFLASRGGASL